MLLIDGSLPLALLNTAAGMLLKDAQFPSSTEDSDGRTLYKYHANYSDSHSQRIRFNLVSFPGGDTLHPSKVLPPHFKANPVVGLGSEVASLLTLHRDHQWPGDNKGIWLAA
jgi:hypothetical protein